MMNPQKRPDAQPTHCDGSVTTVTGNVFDKYRSTHPVHRRLMNRFLSRVGQLVDAIEPRSVVEVGCGPGDLAARLFPSLTGEVSGNSCPDYLGIDIGLDTLRQARGRCPAGRFMSGDAHHLALPDRSAQLVLGCEVLEHLESPEEALAEMIRVSNRWILISVPWEPIWRCLNLARGAYWTRLGNTPGHIQHFSRRSIVRLVARHATVHRVTQSLPWTIVLAQR